MKRRKILLLSLVSLVMCIIFFCGLDKNSFDPSNPDYKKPSLTFDSLAIANGDTVSNDSLVFAVKGNYPVNR